MSRRETDDDDVRSPEPLYQEGRDLHYEPSVSVRGREMSLSRDSIPSEGLTASSSAAESQAVRKKNVGGLVSALVPVVRDHGAMWMGWSGKTIGEDGAVSNAKPTPYLRVSTEGAFSSFPMDAVLLSRFYNGFCNRVLWPALHTFPDRMHIAGEDWDAYCEATMLFAAATISLVPPDMPIWVHDYHLLLLGDALRRRGQSGRMGLFLHTPFCAVDVFSIIPWARTILASMMQFDILGFHTRAFVTNFIHAAVTMCKAKVTDDNVLITESGRRCRVAVFPIGIDPLPFTMANAEPASNEIGRLLSTIAPRQLIIGVDRLDYSKGIPERLTAFRALLEKYPQWRQKLCFLQIAVPSREEVQEYASQRAQVESLVGRINGEIGELDWVPVRFLYRSYPQASRALRCWPRPIHPARSSRRTGQHDSADKQRGALILRAADGGDLLSRSGATGARLQVGCRGHGHPAA